MARLAPRTGPLARRARKLLWAVLFGPLSGWRAGHYDGLERFTLPGVDGSALEAARCDSAAPAPKGVVLLCHPLLKFGMDYFFKNHYHVWLAAAGYHVVGFNFKGFGASTVGGVCFADDVDSALRWTRRAYPGLPVHLLGASFGAYHAVHSLARGQPAPASVLLDSPPADIGKFYGRGMLGLVMRTLSRSRWSGPTGTAPLFDALPLPAGLPQLLVYGVDDPYITPRELERLRRLCGAGNLRTFAQCGHLGIRKTHALDYIDMVSAFFDAHSPAPVPAPLRAPLNEGIYQ